MNRIFFIIFMGFMVLGCSSTNFRNITVQTPDLTRVADGTYRGFYDLSGTPVRVTLDVNVQNHRITSIEIIEHRRSPIGRRAENIIETVVERQNLEIDAVSGATASSVAILKAIENALR